MGLNTQIVIHDLDDLGGTPILGTPQRDKCVITSEAPAYIWVSIHVVICETTSSSSGGWSWPWIWFDVFDAGGYSVYLVMSINAFTS